MSPADREKAAAPPSNDDGSDSQARELYILWSARRVAEPDSLRARASAVATVSAAAGAASLVALLQRADEAGDALRVLMGLSLLLFILSVGLSFQALTQAYEHAPRVNLSSTEYIQTVYDASKRESNSIRPWLRRANWTTVAAASVAFASLLLVELFPRQEARQVDVYLSTRGQAALELCGEERIAVVSGRLEQWTGFGVHLRELKSPCQGVQELLLPTQYVSYVVGL